MNSQDTEANEVLKIRKDKKINILEDLAQIARTIKHAKVLENVKPMSTEIRPGTARSFHAKLQEIKNR